MVATPEGGAEQVDYARMGLNLLEQLGVSQVLSGVGGVSDVDLRMMLLGETEFTEEVKAGLLRLDGVLNAGSQSVGLKDGEVEELESVSAPTPTDEQLDALPDIGGGADVGFGGSSRVVDLLKADLYAARLIATRNQMDLRLTPEEGLVNLEAMLQLELTIIMHFNDSVPVPGLGWTRVQLDDEAGKRLRRLRWVHTELTRRDSGLKGLWRRVTNGRRRSSREMVNEMLLEADKLHRLGQGGMESREDLLRKILEPAGLDADVLRELVDREQ